MRVHVGNGLACNDCMGEWAPGGEIGSGNARGFRFFVGRFTGVLLRELLLLPIWDLPSLLREGFATKQL